MADDDAAPHRPRALSEIFGERTLPIDELLRRFDLYNLALSSVDAQTPRQSVRLTPIRAG